MYIKIEMKRDKHLSLKSERWNKKSEQSDFPIAYCK